MRKIWLLAACVAAFAGCSKVSCTSEDKDGFVMLTQAGGPVLTYSDMPLITRGGKVFKDHDRDGKLDVYEDWRRSPEERAADLASQLSIHEIAGLMLCSHMQNVPGTDVNHYGGKIFTQQDSLKAWDLTDEQRAFLKDSCVRSILHAASEGLESTSRWINNIQRYVEADGHGIPVCILSDPRHGASSTMIYQAGGGGDISRWPSSLGMAATFDTAVMAAHGRIAAIEYRAMGISVALSPQIDIASEPRNMRCSGTFGESSQLAADLARAYCDAMQTSPDSARISGAWGTQSVNAMAKHWYGYGAPEGGREGHFANGEYAVFPGNNLAEHMIPFSEGAFKLREGTGCVAAVMPTYDVLWDQDPSGENVATGYSKYFIEKQLRGDCGFGGVVCTDWDITYGCSSMVASGRGKPWGVEDLSVAERHLRILQAGVDQFGGNNNSAPVEDAYALWAADLGEQSARERFELSARRILLEMFRVGVFENPYVDFPEARKTVGCPEFMAAGYDAQVKSVVMLKNSGVLPMADKTMKVYMPKRTYPRLVGPWGHVSPFHVDYPIDTALVGSFFQLVDNPDSADFAIVKISQPAENLGYQVEKVSATDNGYYPITLQYMPYTAGAARDTSIAGGNPLESFTNRTYKGKTVYTANFCDLRLVQDTKMRMQGRPVVAIVEMSRPMVFGEIEPFCDAILLDFGVQNQVFMDIISGAAEPSGLLPMQMPMDMHQVEIQREDVPRDMMPYRDRKGNVYDFGFGLNWSGRISDWRTEKYR